MKELTSVLGRFAVAAILMIALGCNDVRTQYQHLKSSTVGIERRVTLYSCTGEELRSWDTDSRIEDRGGTLQFLYKGKPVTVSGTLVVE